MRAARTTPARRSAVAASDSEAWLTLMLIALATIVSVYDLLVLLVAAA